MKIHHLHRYIGAGASTDTVVQAGGWVAWTQASRNIVKNEQHVTKMHELPSFCIISHKLTMFY